MAMIGDPRGQMPPTGPQGAGGDGPQGAGGNGVQLMPTNEDPFNDPENVKVILHQLGTLEQRLFAIEMTIQQAASVMQSALAQFGQVMAELRSSSDRLQQTMAAPKRFMRDPEGRLQGVAADLPTPQQMLPGGFAPPG